MIAPELASVVIGAVQLVFSAALVPTCLDRRAAVPRTTSIPTGLGLAVIAAVYAGLELWFATGCAAWCSVLWGFIALHRVVRVPRCAVCGASFADEGERQAHLYEQHNGVGASVSIEPSERPVSPR